jgi:predicted glycosyltransferase
MRLSVKPSSKRNKRKGENSTVKIWYDACTGKHMRYGSAIAKSLRQAGHEVVLTTREHPDTLALARILGEKPVVVGKYRPATLFSRLEESAKRIVKFSKLFKDEPPDIAVSHQSVELCRTAFGLGVPIILTADTPHANAVNKLTIPFASTLIVSEALPKRFLEKYCPDSIVQFKGVDEVAWIKDLKQPETSDHKPLIVVREIETKAAYALGTAEETVEITKKLEALGNVLLLKRYNGKKEFVDSATAVANADLVVSAGGTIAREAALQGIPSIIISELGRTYVNTYLAHKGFPLFMSDPTSMLDLSKRLLGRKVNVKTKLAQLENPVDTIEKAVNQLKSMTKTDAKNTSKRKIKD